jgi:endonuclease/exonuclease/phosphatase family metal-dependent hydrolase
MPRSHRFARFCFLLLTVAVGCAGAIPAAPARPVADSPGVPAAALRVMTFNIRYGTAPDGGNAWANRRALALRVIREFDPTILGMQEALRFQLDEIGHALSHTGEVGVGRDDGMRAGEYAAILYDRRRLKVLSDGRFWLSDTPEVPGSMTWGNRYPRIVTWARFADLATSATFVVFNTHWDHESQPSRENSTRLLLQRIAARFVPEDPVLVMGDFNCGADNHAFQQLLAPQRDLHLIDTFRVIHPSVTGVGTFHAFRGNRDGQKIDFVLVSPVDNGADAKVWRILDADIVHTNDDGHYPSDHFPVTATVLLSDANKPPAQPLQQP